MKEREAVSAAKAAEELGVAVNTLRKYSAIIEKVTDQADYFHKKEARRRTYSPKDLADLKAFHNLARGRGLTLEQAARRVYAVSQHQDQTLPVQISPQQLGQLLQGLKATIDSQNQAINDLKAQLAEISQQQSQILDKVEEKGNDFSDLPDISGIVSPDEDEPELTDEQKRAQAMADREKSASQVRAEILQKSRENQQKRQAQQNVHRTLQDMQLPSKKHWWEKFLK